VQAQQGEHGGHLVAQRFGVVPVARHHQDEIIRVAGEFPVTLTVASAFRPLVGVAHLVLPLLVEVIVQD